MKADRFQRTAGMLRNGSIDADALSAGFARLTFAYHLQR